MAVTDDQVLDLEAAGILTCREALTRLRSWTITDKSITSTSFA